MLGMLTADEQSNVPLVFIFIIVGMSAFAVVIRGKYPPFAPISIICFPLRILTLFNGLAESFEPSLPPTKNAPPMRTPAKIIASTVYFIFLLYQKLKSGGITPIAAKLLRRLKRPKNITTNPAVLKNTPDCAFL